MPPPVSLGPGLGTHSTLDMGVRCVWEKCAAVAGKVSLIKELAPGFALRITGSCRWRNELRYERRKVLTGIVEGFFVGDFVGNFLACRAQLFVSMMPTGRTSSLNFSDQARGVFREANLGRSYME